MAGSIQLSGSQQFDSQGRPLSGGLLYFFASGTTTPQNAFQDTPLTIPYSNPIVLDASGRVPFFYLADGLIKIRLTDNTGLTVIAADGLLVIGPSSGGGGGASIDPNSVLATGDVKARYGTGILSGFVRANGRTIGSATSGGTERANADAQALFEYLWAADPNLAVSGGRGGSANADFLANKTIALPDMRGRTIAGMDDMGAAAASRLTSTFFGASATVLGNAGGNEKHTLLTAEIPAHTHSGVTASENATITHNFSGTTGDTNNSLDHTHGYTGPTGSSTAPVGGSGVLTSVSALTTGTSSIGFGSHTHNFGGTTGGQNQNHQHGFTTDNGTGGGGAHQVVGPTMVMTFYMKL